MIDKKTPIFALILIVLSSFATATYIDGFSQVRIAGDLSLNATTNLTFYANERAVVFINNASMVGIGTVNPSTVLDVAGNATIQGNLNVTGMTYFGSQAFTNIDASGNINAKGNMTINNTVFFVDRDLAKVGIGTTSPSYALDVIGSIRASSNITVGDNVLFENGEVLAVNGRTNLTTLSGIRDVFVYDTSKDSDGGAWTCDERAKTTSWYNETLNDGDRGKTRCFPQKAILINTDSNLTIYDAKDNSMWMIFNQGGTAASGNENLIGNNGANELYGGLFALNGKIYLESPSNAHALFIVDFIDDSNEMLRAGSDGAKYNGNIGERNDGKGRTIVDRLRIANNAVRDVHANVINGKTYVAVATDGGVSVICEECNNSRGTVVDIVNTNSGSVYNVDKNVWLSDDGNVYWTWDSSGLQRFLSFEPIPTSDDSRDYDSVKHPPIYFLGTTATWNGAGTEIRLTASEYKIDSLYLKDGTSTIDGKSNTIYLGTTGGLLAIQQKQGDEGNGSVKYYTANYTSEEMIGDVKGYWNMETKNASGNLTDLSVNSNNGIPFGGVTIGNVLGVRGNATYFDGSDDFINISTTKIIANAGSFTVGCWVKTTDKDSSNACYSEGNSTSGYSYFIVGLTTGNALFTQRGDTGSAAILNGPVVNDSKWHLITAVKDSSTRYLYVDGVLQATSSTTVNSQAVDNVNIGLFEESGGKLFFEGNIDEVFVTATALTPSQIKHMYEVGKRALTYQNQTGLSNRTRLFGSTNNVTSIAVDDKNQYIYAGTKDDNDNGGVSVIGKDSDVLMDWYGDGSKTDDDGTAWNADDIQAISVHDGIVAIGTDTEVWMQAPDISTEDHIRENFNPHGANLLQEKLTTNGIYAKDGNVIELGVAGPPQQSPSHQGQGDLILKIDRNLSISDKINESILYVDKTNERIGIGETSPLTHLHVTGASAGAVSLPANYNTLVVEDGTTSGITILGLSYGGIQFGDAADPDVGAVRYAHTDNAMRFDTAGSQRMIIDASGNVGINDSSPSVLLDIGGGIRYNQATEYSPLYVGDALAAIKNIRPEPGHEGDDWAEVDHDTLPDQVRVDIKEKGWLKDKETGEEEREEKVRGEIEEALKEVKEEETPTGFGIAAVTETNPKKQKIKNKIKSKDYNNTEDYISNEYEQIEKDVPGRDVGKSIQLNTRAIQQIIEILETGNYTIQNKVIVNETVTTPITNQTAINQTQINETELINSTVILNLQTAITALELRILALEDKLQAINGSVAIKLG